MCALHIIILLYDYLGTILLLYTTCLQYLCVYPVLLYLYFTHELDALQEIVFKSFWPLLQFPDKFVQVCVHKTRRSSITIYTAATYR
jgi:hypothetical protein